MTGTAISKRNVSIWICPLLVNRSDWLRIHCLFCLVAFVQPKVTIDLDTWTGKPFALTPLEKGPETHIGEIFFSVFFPWGDRIFSLRSTRLFGLPSSGFLEDELQVHKWGDGVFKWQNFEGLRLSLTPGCRTAICQVNDLCHFERRGRFSVTLHGVAQFLKKFNQLTSEERWISTDGICSVFCNGHFLGSLRPQLVC